ncbi:MAG: hypothetical protein ABL933_00150 [Methyloglobulus sp.]
MSQLFRRFLGLILLIATVGIATCQSLVKAETGITTTVSAKLKQ